MLVPSAFAVEGPAITTVSAKPLPAFAAKVALHNFAGAGATEDGAGVCLYRLPATVCDGLSEKARAQMRLAAHGEIRFVLNEGEKLENVKITLDADHRPGQTPQRPAVDPQTGIRPQYNTVTGDHNNAMDGNVSTTGDAGAGG